MTGKGSNDKGHPPSRSPRDLITWARLQHEQLDNLLSKRPEEKSPDGKELIESSPGKELILHPSRELIFSKSVTRGHDVLTGEEVAIGDTARRAGLYVMGRTGSGKTGMLVSLMDQDIRNGHGLFLLDPHGDAIEKLVSRTDPERLRDAIKLDPRDNDHSFGLNLLACPDPKSWKYRTDTFERVKAVSTKVFYTDQYSIIF
jgi:hypothetical protein